MSQCGSTHRCLSRSVREIHKHVAGTLSHQTTAWPYQQGTMPFICSAEQKPFCQTDQKRHLSPNIQDKSPSARRTRKGTFHLTSKTKALLPDKSDKEPFALHQGKKTFTRRARSTFFSTTKGKGPLTKPAWSTF